MALATPHPPSPEPIVPAAEPRLHLGREAKKILAWRAQCMYDAGLRDWQVGLILARSSGDLHHICDWIGAGATHEQLLRTFRD